MQCFSLSKSRIINGTSEISVRNWLSFTCLYCYLFYYPSKLYLELYRYTWSNKVHSHVHLYEILSFGQIDYTNHLVVYYWLFSWFVYVCCQLRKRFSWFVRWKSMTVSPNNKQCQIVSVKMFVIPCWPIYHSKS